MTTFETLEKQETEFGQNNFVQVARKVANSDDGSTEFIALTRGYFDGDGSKRYKTNLTLPPEPELLDFVEQAVSGLEAS